MAGFDGNDYRRRVLSTLAAAPTLQLDDPFMVVDLDLSVDDEDTIRARLDEVTAFWQRERNSPKYKGLAGELVRRLPELEAVLLDPSRRREARRRVHEARKERERTGFARLDQLVERLVARQGGVPASRVDSLWRVAERDGIRRAEFDARLARHPLLLDATADVQPLSPALRRQIRAQLDELGRLKGDATVAASLWAFLDQPPTASQRELAERYRILSQENDRRPHDRQKTVTAELLAQAKHLLIGGDRVVYAASLVEDAKDRLRDRVQEKVIIDGELSAADFEALVREAHILGYGLSNEQARSAVRALTFELGAALATAPAVDYVICPECRQPEAVTGSRTCRYCGTPLYQDCPSCGHSVEAAALACPHCGQSPRVLRQAQQALDQARTVLREGHPERARALLAKARPRLAGTPRLAAVAAALARDVDVALSTARDEWRRLERDLAARRLYAAVDRAAKLVRTAADVPSPAGASAQDRLADLSDRKAAVQAEVVAARGLPSTAQEQALNRALTIAADCQEALDAIARLPLAPPSNLASEIRAGTVCLRWRPSPSPGPVAYRITRVMTDPTTGVQETRSLGTTGAIAFEDAGTPGGAIVSHEVVAESHRRKSTPLVSTPQLLVREIEAVRAEMADSGVQLNWSFPTTYGVATIERTVDPASGLSVPTRRIRGQGGAFLDTDVLTGVTYHYQVLAEYHDPNGTTVRTPGRKVTVEVVPRPQPVRDLRAATTSDRTVLSWTAPPAGKVWVYAASAPLAAVDDEVDPDGLGSHARLVGTGLNEIVDRSAGGLVVYTPLTVDGPRAVAGEALRHLAVAPVANLRAVDQGDAIRLQWSMPPGCTEAYVTWRRDGFPDGPDDPSAQRAKVTNSLLEIKGGWAVEAPHDGNAWYFSVYPVVRVDRQMEPVEHPARLQVREPAPVHATYGLRRAGWRRRTLVVEVVADGPLPEFVLVARPGAEAPQRPGDGTELARLPESMTAATTVRADVALNPADLPMAVRLFPVPGMRADRLTLTEPADHQLALSR